MNNEIKEEVKVEVPSTEPASSDVEQAVTNSQITKASDLPVTDYLNPVVWDQMKGMAEVFSRSGALNKGENTPTLLIKLQAGREMGLKPIESIKSFYFVNGSINIYGSALVRRFREHGWNIEYKDEEGKCTAIVSKGEVKITETFTFEEAKKSGWVEAYGKLKPGWISGINRRLKLRYGVLSIIIKTQLPDLLGSATDIAEIAMDSTQVSGIQDSAVPSSDDDGEPATTSQIATIQSMDKSSEYANEEGLTRGQAKEIISKLATKGGKNG